MHLNNQHYLQICSIRCSSKHNGAGESLGKLVKTQKFKDNRKITMFSKYGTDSMVTINRDKIKENSLEKYGVDNPLKSKEVRQLRDDSVLENYGVSSILKVEHVRDQIKQTNIERYGSESHLANKDIIEKSRATKLKKFKSETLIDKLNLIKEKNEVKQLDWSVDDFTGTRTKKYKWIHSCGYEFISGLDSGKLPSCPKCNKVISRVHYEVINFCKDLGLDFIVNDRNLIGPREVDLYFPDKKIGIEINGVYWHSEKAGKDKNYHITKTEKLEEKGIKLIHIFDDEWLFKKDIVKSRLRSIFGLDDRIYARKCDIVKVTPKEARTFSEDHHLHGHVNAKVKLGLKFNGELVAIMTFGVPRFNKKYKWELLRYVSKGTVIGGASKLLKYFKSNNTGSIISYADRFWSVGNLYEKLGFDLIEKSGPGYSYVDMNSNKISRVQAQKHKLKKLLGNNFNPDLTEAENMRNSGYEKIWNCGNYVFGLN